VGIDMGAVIAVLTIVALVVAWHFFLYKQSDGRTLSWLWSAFGVTTASAISLVAGTIGYRLDSHDRFVARSAWAGHILWSEIGVGFAMALIATFLWRKGLQNIRQEARGSRSVPHRGNRKSAPESPAGRTEGHPPLWRK